jgi:hypothetical protein
MKLRPSLSKGLWCRLPLVAIPFRETTKLQATEEYERLAPKHFLAWLSCDPFWPS